MLLKSYKISKIECSAFNLFLYFSPKQITELYLCILVAFRVVPKNVLSSDSVLIHLKTTQFSIGSCKTVKFQGMQISVIVFYIF